MTVAQYEAREKFGDVHLSHIKIPAIGLTGSHNATDGEWHVREVDHDFHGKCIEKYLQRYCRDSKTLMQTPEATMSIQLIDGEWKITGIIIHP